MNSSHCLCLLWQSYSLCSELFWLRTVRTRQWGLVWNKKQTIDKIEITGNAGFWQVEKNGAHKEECHHCNISCWCGSMATIQTLVIMKIDFLDKYLYLQFKSWIEKETMKDHIWKFHLLVIALFCYNERWPGKVSVASLIKRALMSPAILMLLHAMWTTMLMCWCYWQPAIHGRCLWPSVFIISRCQPPATLNLLAVKMSRIGQPTLCFGQDFSSDWSS